MSLAWLEQPERGSPTLIRLFTWLTLRGGHSFGRILLYPACLYFLVFSVKARKASHVYLSKVLERSPKWKDIFHHYYTYACMMHDRIYLLKGSTSDFDIRIKNAQLIESLIDQKRGFILLGSHLGSFELLRSYGVLQKKLAINILMNEDNADKSNSVLYEIYPQIQEGIIQPGRPESVLKMKECLDRGEMVGILGDRMFSNSKEIKCDFMGKQASFPAGPIILAGILKVPVILFFGIYHGGKQYEICFEPFAESIQLSRHRRTEDAAVYVQQYAKRLEHFCRIAPYNWFNFYDFWDELDH